MFLPHVLFFVILGMVLTLVQCGQSENSTESEHAVTSEDHAEGQYKEG